MGANAQTTVPSFQASQVLTADQMNQSARTGVPVFATTGTRDAAFGGTGEKTLAEGQMCYIEGTGFQTYNGTSWVTWGTAPSADALVVVKAETAFSAASSITADNIFTSTYTTYRLVVRYTTSSTGPLLLRLRASASSAATNYNRQTIVFADTTSFSARSTSQTSMNIGEASNGSFFCSSIIDIVAPQLAEPTSFSGLNNTSNGGYTGITAYVNYGNHTTATAYDGIELLTGSGTTTGNYTVYGYAKS